MGEIEGLSPAQVLERGFEKALAAIENMPTPSVAQMDQLQAATAEATKFGREAEAAIRELRGVVDSYESTPGEPISRERWAVSCAFVMYAKACCRPRQCPHAGQLIPLVYMMACRCITCEDCALTMAMIHGEFAPDRCDWCLEPTEEFYPNIVQHNTIRLHTDCCESCSDEFRAALPIPP